MQNDKAIDNIPHYTVNSHKLMPLRGKVPIIAGWTTMSTLSDAELTGYVKSGMNLGWVLGDRDLIVDVDPRNGGNESFLLLEKELNAKIDKTVKSIGGFHCYLKYGGGLKLRKMLKEYPGIDFLTKGNQCVIPGVASSWMEK